MLNHKYSLLGKRKYQLINSIIIHIPTIGEIRDNQNIENMYFQLIYMFTRTQCDMMTELDDLGLDYINITNYDLFVSAFNDLIKTQKLIKQIKLKNNLTDDDIRILKDNLIFEQVWGLLFDNLDICSLTAKLSITDDVLFCNDKMEVIIDEKIFEEIAEVFRQMLFIIKNDEYLKIPDACNRKYVIERARQKKERAKNRKNKNNLMLDNYILLLVNDCNFKYNFETVNNITIYDLYCSLYQITKNKEVDGILTGYYTGNIDGKEITDSKVNRYIL